MCSPRPWGWSDEEVDNEFNEIVLPTPVRVVRPRPCLRCKKERAPHARGGGPAEADDLMPIVACSPRPWVGGPCEGWTMAELWMCSPRPWGWSGHLRGGRGGISVLPTPVGVIRSMAVLMLRGWCAPHARGRALPGRGRPGGQPSVSLPARLKPVQHRIVFARMPRNPLAWAARNGMETRR